MEQFENWYNQKEWWKNNKDRLYEIYTILYENSSLEIDAIFGIMDSMYYIVSEEYGN